jgi:hypothetical protein
MDEEKHQRRMLKWLAGEHAVLEQELGRTPTSEEYRAHVHAQVDKEFHAQLLEKIEEQQYGNQKHVGKLVRALTEQGRTQWEALTALAYPFVEYPDGEYGLLPELMEAEKQVKERDVAAADLKVVRLPTAEVRAPT